MNHLDIDRIAFIGRTYNEYMKMFDLDDNVLGTGRILDCAAGPSSFTAEAVSHGFDVSACDVFYDLNPVDLFLKGIRDIAYVFEKFDDAADNYIWDFYKDKEHVISFRKKALGWFAKDFTKYKNIGRYTKAELPDLPYPDNHFTLVLSGHFLFLYGDRMDTDFHTACLKELIRVCSGEIRIYPLCGLDARPYPYMDDIRSLLDTLDIRYETVHVPFEFQRGSNRMMVIHKNEGKHS